MSYFSCPVLPNLLSVYNPESLCLFHIQTLSPDTCPCNLASISSTLPNLCSGRWNQSILRTILSVLLTFLGSSVAFHPVDHLLVLESHSSIPSGFMQLCAFVATPMTNSFYLDYHFIMVHERGRLDHF